MIGAWMNEPTIRERLTRIETILENHIHHHELKDKWMIRIVGGLVSGIIMLILPGFLCWIRSVI
jgi:hypothetical protein